MNHFVLHICEIIPPIGVAEGIGGEPFAEASAVVTHEERMAEAINERLAGEERIGRKGLRPSRRWQRIAESGEGRGGVALRPRPHQHSCDGASGGERSH